MKTNKEVWYYDILHKYNDKKYADILTSNMVNGDEIAMKEQGADDYEYFYPVKKDKSNYLLPSDFVDELPVKIVFSDKIQHKGKAYHLIEQVKSVSIKAEQTMSYKEMINSWINFDHLSPKEYLVWKIVCDTAYRSRVNVRAMSYPGWLKDSPLATLSLLRGDVSTVNKPTFAKLKWLLNGYNKVLGINEIQGLKAEEASAIAKYLEDVGDFKTTFVGDSRASSGTSEIVDITNHSCLLFYN